MKEPIICYLYTRFDSIQKINDFAKHYKIYRPGLKHKLIICFKLLNAEEIENAKHYLKGIKFEEFIDPCKENDWDFGSYKRVSRKYYNKDILFLKVTHIQYVIIGCKKYFFQKKK